MINKINSGFLNAQPAIQNSSVCEIDFLTPNGPFAGEGGKMLPPQCGLNFYHDWVYARGGPLNCWVLSSACYHQPCEVCPMQIVVDFVKDPFKSYSLELTHGKLVDFRHRDTPLEIFIKVNGREVVTHHNLPTGPVKEGTPDEELKDLAIFTETFDITEFLQDGHNEIEICKHSDRWSPFYIIEQLAIR